MVGRRGCRLAVQRHNEGRLMAEWTRREASVLCDV
jgi:hypothetical protein